MAKKTEIPAGRGYHHGNLRQALLDEALALIEAGEEQGVSLRTVAARAGVSNAAPYRHFQDREALMAAVATIGFDRLRESLGRARESAGEGAELLAMATAYLAFASKMFGTKVCGLRSYSGNQVLCTCTMMRWPLQNA